MRSNRTIQTIIQAITLLMVTAIVFTLPSLTNPRGGQGERRVAHSRPSNEEIAKRFRNYFDEDELAKKKADLKSVEVKDISVEGTTAYVKLRLQIKWKGHNPQLDKGPLKNAPGQRGDTYQYTEVFKFRRWSKGWDLEARREPALLIE